MILAEPPPSQGDLHFRVAGIPVRVHPFFWLVALLTGMNAGRPQATMLWMVAVFLSIVVHELGHAVVQRYFGGWPRIVLHGFGGLAICGDCDRSPRSQMWISFAGPTAGFLLAAVLIVVVGATSGDWRFESWWQAAYPGDAYEQSYVGVGWIFFQKYPQFLFNELISDLLQINILWGLLNLLPIYPLDGGQIARELLTLGSNPRQGIIFSWQLSTAAAGAMAVVGLLMWGSLWGSLWVALMFGYLAYQSYQNLQAYTGRGPGRGW